MFRTPKRTKPPRLECAELTYATPPGSGRSGRLLKLQHQQQNTETSSSPPPPPLLNDANMYAVFGPSLPPPLPPPGATAHMLNNFSPKSLNVLSPTETKRGRPRAEVLNTLILQGSTSPSPIKCDFCNRVFPREKSLQAHRRIHTGEKPYVCDFPRCTKRFAQSGQLKTHQRLHTGEKPFACGAPHCDRRFTHANRHCPDHPEHTLRRYNAANSVANIENHDDEAHKIEIQQWFEAVKMQKSLAPHCSTPKKPRSLKETWLYHHACDEQNENFNSENQLPKAGHGELTYGYGAINYSTYHPPSSLDITPPLDESVSVCGGTNNERQPTPQSQPVPQPPTMALASTPVSSRTELPKKRWLREAVREQARRAFAAADDEEDEDNGSTQDLASPINWGEENGVIEAENQKRPTVLVKAAPAAGDDAAPLPASVDIIQQREVAAALVELADIVPPPLDYSL